MRTILVVCTGNTCRSPMAESMLKEMARRAGKPLEVRSAGVGAIDGYPVSPRAAEALKRRGLPVPGRSTALTAGQISWADLILAMTSSHKRAIIQNHPDAAGKTYTLKEFAFLGDPSMDDVAEAERLYTEWQIKMAMGQKMDEADDARLQELQRRMPDFDIADPFGGTQEVYERSADEIEDAIRRVVNKLGNNPNLREAD